MPFYTFANATTAIPLANLDANFATPITLGNTAITINGTFSTVGNLTLQNATLSSLSAPVTVTQGGTNATSLTANNVIIGNGTSTVTFVAPGTSGNVLTSNGTNWTSTAAPSSGFPITIGNTSIASGSTTTALGNLTLNNTNVTSVAVTFPNSFLANSSVTIGNTAVSLGSTQTTFGNVTLNNANVASGVVNGSNITSTVTMAATGNAYMNIATLTDGATITPNFGANNNFTVTLGGNRTLANATNLTAGQSGVIYVVQDATGGRTLSFGSIYRFPSNTAPTLSTAANAVDALFYCVRSTTSITVNSLLNIA